MHGAFQISPRKGDKLLLFIIIEKPVLVVLLHLLALLFIFIFFNKHFCSCRNWKDWCEIYSLVFHSVNKRISFLVRMSLSDTTSNTWLRGYSLEKASQMTLKKTWSLNSRFVVSLAFAARYCSRKHPSTHSTWSLCMIMMIAESFCLHFLPCSF